MPWGGCRQLIRSAGIGEASVPGYIALRLPDGNRRRGCPLDQVPVVLQVPAVVEGHRGHYPVPVQVRGGEPAVLGRSLGHQDLAGERRHAHGLDVRTELHRPERRHAYMRPAVRAVADHVVRRHLRPDHRVLPVLQGQELVLIQCMGEPGHIAGREHVIDRHPVHGIGAAAGITRDPERPDGQPGAGQPPGVAQRAQGDHRQAGLDRGPVRQRGGAEAAAAALQRLYRNVAAQVDSGAPLQPRRHLAHHSPQRPHQRVLGPFHHRYLKAPLAADRGDLGPSETGADHEHPLRPGVQQVSAGHQVADRTAAPPRRRSGTPLAPGTRTAHTPGTGQDPRRFSSAPPPPRISPTAAVRDRAWPCRRGGRSGHATMRRSLHSARPDGQRLAGSLVGGAEGRAGHPTGRRLMTTAVASAAPATIPRAFAGPERPALAGFLAGSGVLHAV